MNKLLALFLVIALALGGCAQPAVQATATLAPAVQATLPRASTPTPAPPTATPSPAPSATPTTPPTPTATPTATATAVIDITQVISSEMHASFNFFWEQANTTPGSPGFGLVRDRYPGSPGIASSASVGFGLTALAVGVEKGYITRQQGAERASQTLDTLAGLERKEGFYYHFIDMQTGKRAWESEISSIDTAILMMGVLTAGEYFGGEVQTKAGRLYDAVNWPWFLDPDRQMFYMAYRPEKGFEGHWDFYAEQLMLYVLAAGSDTHPVDEKPYYTFIRHTGSYGSGLPFIHSWFGSIFTYQYSHAWIDFRPYQDKDQVNWFDNSVAASQAQVAFARDQQGQYSTLGANAWGLSACDGPLGYNGTYGAPPSGYDNNAHFIDDTLPPSGAIGSILFVPQEALDAMAHYASFSQLQGPYGFTDAFNLSKNWFDGDVIGIDKGITLLMLANYQDGLVYAFSMKNAHLLKGLERLEIRKHS